MVAERCQHKSCNNDPIELLRQEPVKDELRSEKPMIVKRTHDQTIGESQVGNKLPKETLDEGPCLFYKELKAVKADESKISVICGKLQISFLIGRGLAATFTLEGEGFADQGWTVNHDIIGAICTDCSEAIF